ncbi:LysR family transcriptional regulator [Temperatibacter marinus]|uniref:LysR family transcriptional regulator n=1 Tax=Temperatibacter marinus TaxID=1456591 RepID=A0AA52EI59_9PROT|nr:LysR family transcriptional regulator [Temperatibacter marinus]WND02982.1 LysR family transcriptional regulator [Temperatibacter marinus]
MDTKGLKLFVLAAEKLNISAAGKQLGIAPAVASARLAKLEHQVGADLLHRSTRKVSLSLEGSEFLPFAKEILAQEDAAKAALGHGSAVISGTLKFAATSTFAQLYIMPILPEFLELYPSIKMDMKLSDTKMDLIEGAYDLALRNYAIEDSTLKARKLAGDKRILCASPSYLKKHGTPQVPSDLDKHQLVLLNSSSNRKLLTSSPKSETFYFPPSSHQARITCDDGASIRIATKSGAGISMNSLWSIHQDLKDGSLIRVLPDYEISDQSALWLVYPKSNVLTAKVRVFIDFLVEKIGRCPSWEE